MNRNFKDGLNFISKATPKRILNATGLLASYYYSRITGKAHSKGLPISISFIRACPCGRHATPCIS